MADMWVTPCKKVSPLLLSIRTLIIIFRERLQTIAIQALHILSGSIGICFSANNSGVPLWHTKNPSLTLFQLQLALARYRMIHFPEVNVLVLLRLLTKFQFNQPFIPGNSRAHYFYELVMQQARPLATTWGHYSCLI